jgi:hypothetical protein
MVTRLAMMGAAMLAVIGCGGSYTSQVRRGLYVAAETLVVVDESVAPKYAAASAHAVEVSDTVAEYTRLMAPWDAVELRLRMARASLLRAETEVGVYERDGTRLGLLHSVGCSIVLLEDLWRDLRDAGVDPPPGLVEASAVLKPFAGVCDAAE